MLHMCEDIGCEVEFTLT